MTKLDFKTRKELFQSGPIRRHKNFPRFEAEARLRRKRETRMKIVVAIGILILVVFMVLNVAGENRTLSNHPEQKVEVKQGNL